MARERINGRTKESARHPLRPLPRSLAMCQPAAAQTHTLSFRTAGPHLGAREIFSPVSA